MRPRNHVAFVFILTCGLFLAFLAGVANAATPPMRVDHLGWVRAKKCYSHSFRITLVNRHSEPVWFVLPDWPEESLPKNGIFRNRPSEQPFEGGRYSGKDGWAVYVNFLGREAFTAFRLPAKGRLEHYCYICHSRKNFDKLEVFEARQLRVNGRTPLPKWLPFDTMCGKKVRITEDSSHENLDWDEKKGTNRDDYPKEKVKTVKAKKFRIWRVKFIPKGKQKP